MMINNRIVSFISCLLLLCFASCSLFVQDANGEIIARVQEHILTKDDIAAALEGSYGEDSATVVQGYINEWATNKLLIEGALRNLPAADKESFEGLVENYRNDLYTKYYKDALVQKQLDSVVSDAEAQAFYDDNKNNFLLNEQLVQFRFIQLDENYVDIESIKRSFTRFDKEDRYALDSLRFQFKNYFLADSVWVKSSMVVRQVHPITASNAEGILKKTNFLQLRDSLGLYLIAVKNTLGRNDIAPLQYVRPTINQIIKNKRKVELVKKLEKEIKDDAIKNKKFEIYN